MPRPRKLDRPRRLEIQLPESIYAKIMTELYSEVEGRVPLGKVSEVGTELFSSWLKSRGVVV